MTVLAGGAASDVGRVRTVNQDGALASSFLFAVADGMGGHRGGEVASALALRALGGRAQFASARDLVAAVEQANQVVHGAAQDDPDLRGMGTTLCAIALVASPDILRNTAEGDQRLVVVNVGDSRAYRLGAHGTLEQLTVDHSLVQMMVEDGQITAEEAEHHPQRNIVTRALGIEATVDVDVWELAVVPGQRFLVCSDGLFGEVDLDRMASELRRWADPSEAARQLVDLANAAGGRDNITCAIFDVLDGDGDGAMAGAARSARTALAGAAAPDQTATGDEPSTWGSATAGPGSGTAGSLTGTTTVQTVAERHAAPTAPTAPGERVSPRHVTGRRGPERRAAPEAPEAPTARPRRFTLRVAVFLVAVVTVLGLAALAVGWYATRTYFVGTEAGEVVIYRGRPGGILWLDPSVAEPSDVPVAELSPQGCDIVASEPSTTDLGEARAIVERVRADAARRPPTAARCELG